MVDPRFQIQTFRNNTKLSDGINMSDRDHFEKKPDVLSFDLLLRPSIQCTSAILGIGIRVPNLEIFAQSSHSGPKKDIILKFLTNNFVTGFCHH